MKINLYEELKNCGVFPVRNSTANLILSGSIEPAALNIFMDHKKHASERNYYLNKNSLKIDKDFNLSNFTSSSFSSLIKDEVEVAQSEEEDQTIEQISQWLR